MSPEELGLLSDSRLIWLPREATRGSLDAHLSRLDAAAAREARAYVFAGGQADLLERLSDAEFESDRDSLRRRAKGKPTYYLRFSQGAGLHELSEIRPEAVRLRDDGPAEAIRRVRSADLRELLSASGDCFFEASSRLHFITPAQHHCGAFLRVGELVRSVSSLDRMACWILPALSRADGVLLDTWSIAAVLLRAFQQLRADIPFDCFESHPLYDQGAARTVVEKMLQVVLGTERQRLTCVVSVTSTGTYLRLVEEMLEHAGLSAENVEFISFYAFSDSPQNRGEVLCRLARSVDNAPPADCKRCPDSEPVRVDPRFYYLRVPSDKPVLLGQSRFAAGRPFLEEFGHVPGFLRVHRSGPNDGRHHAFDLDVGVLLDTDAFRGFVIRKVDALLSRPQLVVTPTHAAGRKLGDLISKHLGVGLLVHDDLRWERLDPSQQEAIRGTRHILVVDDVAITGSRLDDFNRSLREGDCAGFDSVRFLVGIARPKSSGEWERIQRMLGDGHQWDVSLDYVRALFIPNWQERDCPWCKEFDLISEVVERYGVTSAWLMARSKALKSDKHDGITASPFLLMPTVQDKSLADQAAVGPAGFTSMQTLFSVAVAMEALRNDPKETKRLDPRFPVNTVFNLKGYQLYTEGLIRAALLRTVKPREWGESQQDELRILLERECRKSDQAIMLGELLVSIWRNGIFAHAEPDFKGIFNPHLPPEVVSALLGVLGIPARIRSTRRGRSRDA